MASSGREDDSLAPWSRAGKPGGDASDRAPAVDSPEETRRPLPPAAPARWPAARIVVPAPEVVAEDDVLDVADLLPLERMELDKARVRGTVTEADVCGPVLALTLGPGEPFLVVLVDDQIWEWQKDLGAAQQMFVGNRVIVECSLSISRHGIRTVSVPVVSGLSHVRVIDKPKDGMDRR